MYTFDHDNINELYRIKDDLNMCLRRYRIRSDTRGDITDQELANFVSGIQLATITIDTHIYRLESGDDK